MCGWRRKQPTPLGKLQACPCIPPRALSLHPLCVPIHKPGFHKAYLEACIAMFGRCTQQTIKKLDALTAGSAPGKRCCGFEPEFA